MRSKLVLCFILSCAGMVCCFDADVECKKQYPKRKGTIKAKPLLKSESCSYTCTENNEEIDSEPSMKKDGSKCGDLRETKVCLAGKCVSTYDISYCKEKMLEAEVTVVGMVCMIVCGLKDDDSKTKEYVRSDGFPCKTGERQGKCSHGICRYAKKNSDLSWSSTNDLPDATSPSITTEPTLPKPTKPIVRMPARTTPATTRRYTTPATTRHRDGDTTSPPVPDKYTVDITSFCKLQYRSEATIGYPGNNTYGCMYFCFYNSEQLNKKPIYAQDETPCGGQETYACSGGFCQRKIDIKMCKYYYRKYVDCKIKVTGFQDKCFFKCEATHENASYEADLAVRDGVPCKTSAQKQGICKEGTCSDEGDNDVISRTPTTALSVAPSPSIRLQPTKPMVRELGPRATAKPVVRATSVSNEYTVDMTSLCKKQYGSNTTIGYTGNNTYGCMYFCFHQSQQLNSKPLYAQDDTSCGGKDIYACSGGFCQRKIDIQVCKYYYRNHIGFQTKVAWQEDTCFFKCEAYMYNGNGSFKANVAVRDGEPCKTASQKRGKCKKGTCNLESENGVISWTSTIAPPVAPSPSIGTTKRPKPTIPMVRTPAPTTNPYTVDITSLCQQKYRSDDTKAFPGNSTYGCMYFCFYEWSQLNALPLHAPDETPCGGKEIYACSSGFCERKIDIKMCKYYYRTKVGYKIKVSGYKDKCYFKCVANHELGSYEANIAVRDGEPCRTNLLKVGKCHRGSCL